MPPNAKDDSGQEERRLTEAFLRGYQDSAAVVEGAGESRFPLISILGAAELEGQQMRRTIDVCRDALKQIDELPEAERASVRQEVGATLEPLLAGSEELLNRLRNLSAPSRASKGTDATSAVRPQKALTKKKSRRK
jgi:hypothetical protein